MKTIKLSYKASEEFFSTLKDLQRNQSSIIRYSFNRFQDNLSEKEIRASIKNLNNNLKDSWIVQCGLREAKTLFNRFEDKKIVFGGKFNLKQYLRKQITKEQYKNNKLLPLTIQGEILQKGNRKFELDLIQNNQIVFKLNKKQHFIFELPKLRTNFQKQLHWLENQSKQKKIPFSVKLTKEFIFISFEEVQLEQTKLINNRVFAVDLNPNSIGFSVCDYNKEKQSIVNTGIIDLKLLNIKLNETSTSEKQLYQNNKREFELHQTTKFLIQKALHFQCSKFVVEDLNIENKNHQKGKTFNRTVNNNWNRNLIIDSLKKHCRVFGVQLVNVNPAYSSIIGNTIYKEYPDPINASLELNRRGCFKYQKDKFYPVVPSVDYLNELWKQTLDKNFESWKELSGWLKNSKLRYRIPLSQFDLKFFSLYSPKSCIYLYDVG